MSIDVLEIKTFQRYVPCLMSFVHSELEEAGSVSELSSFSFAHEIGRAAINNPLGMPIEWHRDALHALEEDGVAPCREGFHVMQSASLALKELRGF